MNMAVDSNAKASFKDVYSEDGMDIKKFAEALGITEEEAKKADTNTDGKGKGKIDAEEMKAVFSGKIEGIKLEKEQKEDVFNSVVQATMGDKPAMDSEELDEAIEKNLGLKKAEKGEEPKKHGE